MVLGLNVYPVECEAYSSGAAKKYKGGIPYSTFDLPATLSLARRAGVGRSYFPLSAFCASQPPSFQAFNLSAMSYFTYQL